MNRNEFLQKLMQFGQTAFHYGFIPLLLYIGYTRSNPRPAIMRVISPLA